VEEDKENMSRTFSMHEVAQHNTLDDCWVVVNSSVYDMTDFLKDHPGGSKVVMIYAGKDATGDFSMLHKPSSIRKYGRTLLVGKLA
jgi:cytochrome b involved in lipid metabolism